MNKLLYLFAVLTIGALACTGPSMTPLPEAMTLNATYSVTLTPKPTSTPRPTETPSPEPARLIDGAELFTGGWVSAVSPVEGEGPTFDGLTLSWGAGSGTAGFEQTVELANGHQGAACKLTGGETALDSSSIVTSRVVYRVVSVLKDGNKVSYLDISFYQPDSREFYFSVEKGVESIDVFMGVDKPYQEDFIKYQFSTPSFICYNTTTQESEGRK